MDDNGKIKKILLSSFLGSAPLFFLLLFIIFVAVLFVLGFIKSDNSLSGGSYTKECGFTISKTSLTKGQFSSRVILYAQENPNFQIFADHAEDIYETAVSMNVNPELVVVRAAAEGNGTTTGSYNYWGIGCYNGEGISACHNYSSFEEGYVAYLTNIEQYNTLADMMSVYAYIGDYWFKPGNSADGGCYYAPYIYGDLMPSHVEKACSATAPICTTAGESGCTPTTEDDQKAYATWQIEQNMATIRKDIFGLEFDEGPCVYSVANFNRLESYTLNGGGLPYLNRALTEDEIGQLNNYIDEEASRAGNNYGARVAAAGQALAYGLEQMGYRLHYTWGGGRNEYATGELKGVSPYWGTMTWTSDPDNHGRLYYGMDCSGFTAWATRTGCGASYFSPGICPYTKNVDRPTVDIADAKPGDWLVKNDCNHVILVIVNNGDGSIITLEEEGGGGSSEGLVFKQVTATTMSGYKIYDMTSFYEERCAVN